MMEKLKVSFKVICFKMFILMMGSFAFIMKLHSFKMSQVLIFFLISNFCFIIYLKSLGNFI